MSSKPTPPTSEPGLDEILAPPEPEVVEPEPPERKMAPRPTMPDNHERSAVAAARDAAKLGVTRDEENWARRQAAKHPVD